MIPMLAQLPQIAINLMVVGFLIVCLIMILTVLIQKPQGGGLSGAFGSGAGSGQTAFGARTGDALTVATIGIFVFYIVAAIGLNYMVRPSTAAPVLPQAQGEGETTPAPVTPGTTGPTPIKLTPVPAPPTAPTGTTTAPAPNTSTPPTTTPPAATPPAATPGTTEPAAPPATTPATAPGSAPATPTTTPTTPPATPPATPPTTPPANPG